MKERQRKVYVTARQKKKLLELITKHPELISCKVTQNFSYRDSQTLWRSIADECNSLPGARKTWTQWRKTWQDLRSNTKKRQAEINGELPSSAVLLTPAEREALGLINSLNSNDHESPEFIQLEQNDQFSMDNAVESNDSCSEEEESEKKVFSQTEEIVKHEENKRNNSKSDHSNTCVFNCNMLAKQEQRKINIKEDYLNFKKNYLRQKLKLLKEQTEALKMIAKELTVNK